MANNLPPIWRFDWSDYQELGTAFQKFIANLNLFTLAVYNLMNGGIGFANMQRSIYNKTVTAASTTTFSFVNPLPIVPSGLSLVKVSLASNGAAAVTSAVSIASWYYDGKNINVLSVPGLTSVLTYNLSIEVM